MTVMPLTPPPLIAAVAVVGLAGLMIGASVGAWLTGMTVTVKVWVTLLTPPLAVLPLFVTNTVIRAVPLAPDTGV